MATRAEELAERFEQINDEFISMVEAASPEQWQATCASEGWSVGVTAHHIASSHEPVAGLAHTVATGQPVPPLTREMIDQGNARHAQEFAGCTKEETVELLRRSGTTAASLVRGLSDEQLDRGEALPLMGGNTVSAQQIIEMILIGHAQQHLQSIRAAR